MIEPSGQNVHNSKPKENLSAVLKIIRETLDVSQEELARRIGVSSKTIYRWEAGSQPTLTVVQFKRLLNQMQQVGLSLDDLPDN